MKHACLFTLLGLLLTQVHAQAPASAPPPRAIGQPFLRSYAPPRHSGSGNWSVTQDARGVIYVANEIDGVQSYDGATWRHIPIANRATRVVTRDAQGRIWVGSVGEIGYLAPDARGQEAFVSIVDQIPPAARPTSDIWTLHDTPTGLYFNTRTHLYRWRDGQVRVWTPPDSARFGFIFPARGTLYVHVTGVGLARLDSDALVPVSGSAGVGSSRVTVMLPFGQTERGREVTLVGTYDGLFRYDGTTFAPFRTEADSLLRVHAPYRPGAVLPGGRVALGLLGGGLVVLDRAGRLVRHLDRSGGLPSNTVYYTFVDQEGGLWLVLSRGLVRVDLASPLTQFSEGQGIFDEAYDVVRHRGQLYVGTDDGTLVLDEAKEQFRPVAGLQGQVFRLVTYRGALFGWGSQSGLHRIDGTRAVPQQVDVPSGLNAISMVRSRRDTSFIFVSVSDGLAVMTRVAENRWRFRRIPGTDGSYAFAEDAAGDLWIGSTRDGVQRVRFPAGLARVEQARVTTYPLPGKTSSEVFILSSEVYATTTNALYRFDPTRGAFVPDAFGLGPPTGVATSTTMVEDGQGRVWSSLAQGVSMKPRGGGPALTAPFHALHSTADILPEPDGVTWFATESRIVRYDAQIAQPAPRPVATLVRRVAAADSVLTVASAGRESQPPPRLAHDQNAVRFDFAAPFFGDVGQTEYRTHLVGYEAAPAAWSAASYKEYTNLAPGNYVFRVTARNAAGQMATEATYRFSIAPPWWRSVWAYLAYGLMIVGGLWGAYVIQRRRLFAHERARTQAMTARNEELEALVHARTGELEARAEELAVINSVQQGLVAELDMQAIYDLVGERLRDLFDAQAVVIRTYDLAKGTQHLHYAIEKGKRHLIPPLPLDGFHRHLIASREPVLIQDQFTDAMIRHGGNPVAAGEAPKSALYVPMIVGERVLGSVSLQNVDREYAFDEADLRVLLTLTNSMSVALENARLFAETNQRATELDTVNRISRALVSQLEFDALVRLVGEQMRETFEADIVFVALHDQEANMIRFVYEHGDTNADRPFGDGLTERILTSRAPLLVNPSAEEVRARLGAQQIGKVATSFLGVPILVGDVAAGVISVQSTVHENRFDDDSLRLLTTIAANVGIAFQNADAYRRLAATIGALQGAQQQLVQQEKLASLGALTAGIAHEIKNPLNFVNNFAALSAELVREIKAERDDRPDLRVSDVEDILGDLEGNVTRIEEHGRRADAIVKGMLMHARGGSGQRERVDVNTLADEAAGLAYHGLRAQRPGVDVTLSREFNAAVGTVDGVPQDLSRVVLNLVNNALYAVADRSARLNGQGDGVPGERFVPSVRLSTHVVEGTHVELRVWDNGGGIPEAVRAKIFEPFFTTKPTGEGTGLGLSLSHEIVAAHGGHLDLDTDEAAGTTRFTVRLPRTAAVETPQPA